MLVQLGREQQIRIWGNDLDVSENSHALGYFMWLQYHCRLDFGVQSGSTPKPVRPDAGCSLVFETNHLKGNFQALHAFCSQMLVTHEFAIALQFHGFVPLSFFDECMHFLQS